MKKLIFVYFIYFTFSYAQLIPVPETGCYHAAFTGNNTHKEFVDLAKKEIAIEMFFTGWPSNKVPDFPLSKCNEIVSNGSIPHITWMPQVSGSPFPLDGIINGSYDSYIRGYAKQVKNFGKPIFIRLGHEFNGDWYTYGGAKNGGGTKNGFGDPNKPDGPERFIAAYKRVHDLFKEEGVNNVVWIWCPNNGSSPNESWNVPENYYPGDEYVDWIGFDGYNFGRTQSWSGWIEFFDIYSALYQKFVGYNKPLMIAEFASVEIGGNKSEWIRKAYSIYLKYSFPKIKAVTWFHIRKYEGTVDTDWRINSSELSLKAYQDAIADSYYLPRIISTDIEEEKILNKNFILEQNYPNPFNPVTTISYTLPEASFVTIKVYDILGREVATLVNEYKEAGNYTVQFSINNYQLSKRMTASNEYSSGIFFYSLRTDKFFEAKKMVLLK